MRHDPLLIQEVVQMRKDGLTLAEIVSKTKLSKTTIFHHIRNIDKSQELIQKLRLTTLSNQKMGADLRRGRTLKADSFKKLEKWDPDLVNLIAHFLFDGRITSRSSLYYSRNKVLRDLIISEMDNKLGVSDYKIYEAFNGVKRVAYHNVELANFLKTKTNDLVSYINNASEEEKISFLKSFFDDEGCVSFRNGSRVIRGYQHTIRILEIISQLLKEFGIESKIDERFFEIVVSRKKNLIKFQKLINFTPGVTVNGNRSNSIWKKSLEKREILKMAVDSYLT